MSLFSPAERKEAQALGSLGFTNPFTAERVALERQVLGETFVDAFEIWVVDPERLGENPNVVALERKAKKLADQARARLASVNAGEEERTIYEELVLYLLYYRYEEPFFSRIAGEGGSERVRRMTFYEGFERDVHHYLRVPNAQFESAEHPQHLFSIFFQVRRAFHHTFRHILGASPAASALRAAVWESIFTSNIRRYRRSLYLRMHEFSTLILGPSGTGKELVAEAIGRSRYISFDPKSRSFAEDFRECYQPVNLAALPATTIESELFGHKKGAFTGAVSDRIGYLEGRSSAHTIFLDEIGDLQAEIQVKLLRVLQNREFQRLGEVEPRRFEGKVMAATNRDLPAEISKGRFREDLYYRLCSDVIRTPSLVEQIAQNPGELASLARLLAARIAGEEAASELAKETAGWIEENLPGYDWPGNIRELEQCVRNVLLRGHYEPARWPQSGATPEHRFAEEMVRGELSAEQLLGRYLALIYVQEGENYEAAARRLQVDRRTVKSRLDLKFLREIEQARSKKN